MVNINKKKTKIALSTFPFLTRFRRVFIKIFLLGSLILHLRCILTPEAVDLGRMPGCLRKLWENVMEVIVKIEKTNTMTNTWRNTKTKTHKDKNDRE